MQQIAELLKQVKKWKSMKCQRNEKPKNSPPKKMKPYNFVLKNKNSNSNTDTHPTSFK